MPDQLANIVRGAARRVPQQEAVIESRRRISYFELDRLSDGIADALAHLGVRPGQYVALYHKKSIEAVAAIYGILKAGCAYVPIDPRAGRGRLDAVLRDAGPVAILTDSSLVATLDELAVAGQMLVALIGSGGELRLHRSRSSRSPASNCGPNTATSGSMPAYVLYTSGSTGEPRGVQHGDSSAIAFASWAMEKFRVSQVDRLSCHAPLHFDLTILDIFAAGLACACVVLIPEDLAMFPRSVADLIERERISIWYSVPFALSQLLERGKLADRDVTSLREILFAGERFPQPALRRLATAVPRARLTNLFGPTETNVCTYHTVTPEDLANDEFCPIGVSCPYATVAVVEVDGRDVDPGEAGELIVGGACVMQGYLSKPQLNERVFIEREGRMFYRTGDRVRAPKDRPMQFLGRMDRQVKVRGLRIELDAIEAALLSHAGVAAAAVWVQSHEGEPDEIAAALEIKGGAQVDQSRLLADLASSLAYGAVPRNIHILEELPRTPNGKVDRPLLAKRWSVAGV